MQEEVEQRVVTLAINCAKLTEQELKRRLSSCCSIGKPIVRKDLTGK